MFEDIPRPGLWKRLMLGAVLCIFAAAGATAVAGFHEIDKVVSALEQGQELKLGKADLAETDPGEPQTLMILGSDRRAKGNVEGAGRDARSDTIMLVRLNPEKEATAVLSLPRDLKVTIPGHGTDKINAAYELGGVRLTLKTVKNLTGLPINHVINVDFEGFWRAVNAVGCIYVDVDRRYFNDSPQYTFIDIQQGYQRLCGRKALQYVRFRHEDDDIVRAARQQEFLRQAKQQIATSELIEQRDRLLKIFGRNTQTDRPLRDHAEILRLLKLALFSADQPIFQVRFQGDVGASYVEASDEQIQKVVQQFLLVEDSPGPRGTPVRKGPKPKRKRLPQVGDLGLEDATGFGQDQALQTVELLGSAARRLPVVYPKLRTRGSIYAGPPRAYPIRDLDGKRHVAYRMVIQRGVAGEYYGLQGMTWKDPPILEGPTQRRRIARREYEFHYDGDRLRLVAWRTRKAVYWISNTLLLTLNEKQMLAIARSAVRL